MSEITALTVPKWGMAMEEGTLVNWMVKEGDAVSAGDGIAEIESSKIVNVLETHVDGVLRRQVLQQDETLPVGSLVAIIAGPDVSDEAIDDFIAGFKVDDAVLVEAVEGAAPAAGQPEASAPASREAAQHNIPDSLKQGDDDSNVNASPHARRLAGELGINLHNVTGSGRRGRISVDDIEQAVTAAGGAIAGREQDTGGAPDWEEIPLSSMRQTIGRRLQQSKQSAPHFRLVVDVEIDRMEQLRSRLNETRGGSDAKVTLNNLLIKACAGALMEVPDVNVQFHDDTIRRFHHADIALAVALEHGLITPIVKAADTKDVMAISNEVSGLIGRAREGKLGQEEFEGGSFTISNLGMYGIRQFDAIINQPQCAILAVGGGDQRVISLHGQPMVASVVTLSLSLDHRIIDGVTGARFLEVLKGLIHNPERLAPGA